MARYNRANEVDSLIEIAGQFKSRIALIRLNGEESGTGFLVAEKLLLTAQHVVESLGWSNCGSKFYRSNV